MSEFSYIDISATAMAGGGGADHDALVKRDLGEGVPTFPPIERERLMYLRERVTRCISASPRLAGLRDLLLALAGHEVVLHSHEPHLEQLLTRGREFRGEGARDHPMLPSQCHTNAALLWQFSGGAVGIATGYALSEDGLWRQHSWGTKPGLVIETTEPRLRYFGVALSGWESAEFAEENGVVDM